MKAHNQQPLSANLASQLKLNIVFIPVCCRYLNQNFTHRCTSCIQVKRKDWVFTVCCLFLHLKTTSWQMCWCRCKHSPLFVAGILNRCKCKFGSRMLRWGRVWVQTPKNDCPLGKKILDFKMKLGQYIVFTVAKTERFCMSSSIASTYMLKELLLYVFTHLFLEMKRLSCLFVQLLKTKPTSTLLSASGFYGPHKT